MKQIFSVTTEALSTEPRPASGPWRLTLVTNPDDCNLACAMCECGAAWRAQAQPDEAGPEGAGGSGGREGEARVAPRLDGPPRRMAPALADRVLRERAGTPLREVIPSTMGEPLLWSGFDALLDMCRALGLALNLTTNGTFPGRGAAAWAERLVLVASDVKISWNGATARTAEAIMPGLSFGVAGENVRTFVGVRDARARGGHPPCRVSFQVTAQEANVGELAAIVRLAASLGVERVKVNHIQVRFPSLAAQSLRRDAAAIRRWNEAVAQCRSAAEEVRLPGGGSVLLENVVPLAEDPAAPAPLGPCRFVGREAWIHPDGRFAPCPHPAAARGELGDFGSAADRPLGAIWASDAFVQFVRGYEDHPVCRACPFRRPGGA